MRTLVILLFALITAHGAVWYASPTGASTNGTSENPWSILYAVTNGNPHLQPGDTVLLKSGTFVSNEKEPGYDYTNILVMRKSGTIDGPITYKSESLWGFRLDGGFLVPYTTSNIKLRNIYTTRSSQNRVRTNIFENSPSISVFGSNVALLHCVFENSGDPGMGVWKLSQNKVIKGNISRFNGLNDWTSTYAGAPRGSGIYTENLYGEALISGNVFYHNYTDGILLKTELVGFRLTNNLTIPGLSSGITLENNHSPTLGVNIVSNWVFGGRIGVRLGYYGASPSHDDSFGNSNGLFYGNTVYSQLKGLFIDNRWKNISVSNNTIATWGVFGDGASLFDTEYNVVLLENYVQTNNPIYSFTGNRYYSNTNSVNNFVRWGTPSTFSAWTSNVPDVLSSVTIGGQVDNCTVLFRPSEDMDFLYVTVCNWNSNSTVNVNLYDRFALGDSIEIYDAQNIPNSFTNFILTSYSVSIPLLLTNRVSIVSELPDLGYNWTGFDYRFRSFVIHRTAEANKRSAKIRGLRLK